MLTPNQLRAEIVARRTYMRPLNDEGTKFETWKDVSSRVIGHQRWLWERVLGRDLNNKEKAELRELEALILERKALLAGRTLWLGGTETSRQREISMINCSFTHVRNVNDVVDVFWLLLNGCGVGFKPESGTLNGFKKPTKDIQVIRTSRAKDDKGNPANSETFDPETKVWTIKVGDSGEAWAKSIGKLIGGKFDADTLVFDLTEVRGPGGRLKGYGWISSGDVVIAEVYPKIAALLSRKAGALLDEIDILDIINYLGVIQTGRRGAEIALLDYGNPSWRRFATAKTDFWLHDNHHRSQSNNSLLFNSKPTRDELTEVFDIMLASGGSEPGIINAMEMKRRAPFASGVNPCAEILLADASICNLCTLNIAAFESIVGAQRAYYIIGRANYRQTLMNLDDGILQIKWHQTNQFLRLCGISMMGIAMRPLTDFDIKNLKNAGIAGTMSMAMELGTELPKNTTTQKPEGTAAKIAGCTEGIHTPLGKYIFNNITFSKHEPIVQKLAEARYRVFDNPSQPDGVVVTFPVEWDTVDGFTVVNGTEVNLESAVDQLERYKRFMKEWTEQNTSITVSYDETEVPAIIDWLLANWNDYVGVSFIKRADPTKTAADLGYLYLPQEVVSKEAYESYVALLKPLDLLDLRDAGAVEDVDFLDDGCETGVCPIR